MNALNYVDAFYTSLSYAIMPFLPTDDCLKKYIKHLDDNDIYDDELLENKDGVYFYIIKDFESNQYYISSSYEIGTKFTDEYLDRAVYELMNCESEQQLEVFQCK